MFKTNSILKILAGGLLIGLLLHFLVAWYAYTNLQSKIKQSEFSHIIFNDDPSIGMLYSLNKKSKNNLLKRDIGDKIVWRILVNAGVIDWDKSQEDIATNLKQQLTAEINRHGFDNVPTIQHLVILAQLIGAQKASGDISEDSFNDRLSDLIASCLASEPEAFSTYKEAVASGEANFNYHLPLWDFLLPRQLSLTWGDNSDQQGVINLLFIHTQIAPEFDGLPDKPSSVQNRANNNDAHTQAQIYQQINEYFQRMFISINDDHRVIAARSFLNIVEGPEQFFMYIVFGMGLLTLRMHIQVIKKSYPIGENDARFLVTLYRWIQIALPSLGFIGTKRGLSEALGKADAIVRAGSPITQSLAVSNVSSTMGIAFTSTLVGLVLLMMLMILELFIKYRDADWNT